MPGPSDQMLDLRAVAQAADPTTKAEASLVTRSVTATVHYGDKLGVVRLTAPNGDQRTQISRMTAMLGGGLPWDHFPPIAQARFHNLAVYSVCVSDVPDWMDAAVQEDNDLLFAVAGSAEAHAEKYFRGDVRKGEAHARELRVVVEGEDA